MIRKLLQNFMVLTGAVGVAVATLGQPVLALDPLKDGCAATPDAAICKEKDKAEQKVPKMVQNIVNLLIYALGIICVIVIIIAGIMYATAAGDSNQITKAKNAILYAVVGLVVALMAYGIVNFVLERVG